MWFDPQATLAEIRSERGTRAIDAIRAILAGPNSTNSTNSTNLPSGSEELTDAAALLAYLRVHGPASYGATATDLGWGATRAWRAETDLRAAGHVRLNHLGGMIIINGGAE